MNKIAIFGDSFGTNSLGPFGTHTPKDLVEEYRSWIDLIGTTHSYARGGTDIQWSFLEFEKHHNDYDQIIFIITNPFRITLKDENDDKKLFKMISGTDWKLGFQNDNGGYTSPKDNDIETQYTLKALAELEKILIINNSYRERASLFHSLTIERIKQIRPDVKFIAAFPLTDLQIPLMNNCLQDITDYENKIMKWKSVDNRHDTRIAHLTEKSHIILTRLIKEWLKTDEMFFDFDIKEFENINPDIRKYNNG